MSILIAIIGILITIFFVIGTHEAAHFLMARLLGVKVLRFSIGFGKRLLHWHDKKGTEYVLALIPLGGYVKMLDETEGDVPTQELSYAYNRQPFYKKFLIVLAGPAMNLLCALLLYAAIFMIGFTTIKPVIGTITPRSIADEAGLKPNQEITRIDNQTVTSWTGILFRLMTHLGNQDQVTIETQPLTENKSTTHFLDLTTWHVDELHPDPLSSLGVAPYEPPIPLIIQIIAPKSPAAHSSLKLGDKILKVNDRDAKSWTDVITEIYAKPDQTINFTVERQGKKLTLPINIGSQRSFFEKHGFLGISPQFKWPEEMLRPIQYGPIDALQRSWQEVRDLTYFNLILFGKMFTGKLSLQSLGGPITIFESAGDALNSGWVTFLGFLAFLSISVGVINLLPIPGLDGGHLLIQTIEAIIRRPIPERYLLLGFRLGFIFILFVLFQALVNDILRLY